jgi:hypothetical protein
MSKKKKKGFVLFLNRVVKLHRGASILREKDLITFFNCWRDQISSVSPSARPDSENRALVYLLKKRGGEDARSGG